MLLRAYNGDMQMLSISMLGCSKTPMKSVDALKNKTYLHLWWWFSKESSLEKNISPCEQLLTRAEFSCCFAFVFDFWGGLMSRGGTEAKLSSMTDSCFKWSTSQTTPACSTLVKTWSDLSKDVLNFPFSGYEDPITNDLLSTWRHRHSF